MGFQKKPKAQIPKFPNPQEKDGGKETKEPAPTPAQKLTKEQEKIDQIIQQQEMLQNNGVFRLNLLDLKTGQNNILVELGEKVLQRLDRIAVALENLAETEEQEQAE